MPFPEPDVRSIVIVFDRINKEHLKYDGLRSLIDGETPELLNLPDPLSPVVFTYKRAGLAISFFDNRLQVQSSAPEHAKAAREFADISRNILEFLPEQPSIIAFGFNFNYTLKDTSKKVHEIINLPTSLTTDTQFTFIPETFIKFSYDEDGVKHFLSLQDSGSHILVDINVHHGNPTQVDELKKQLSDHYKTAYQNSQRLIREVINP